MIEIKSEGLGSSGYWTNSLEEGDGSSSRFSTFRNFGEYFNYLLWESPNVLQDGIDGGLDVFKAGVEAQELFFNPVYKDKDLPRGDGSCVLIIPGFWGNGISYYLPKVNLERLGWRAEVCPVKYGGHVEPTERMTGPLVEHARKMRDLTGKKIHIIGHSKGGHVALAAAILRTEELAESVDQIVIVDSPIPDRVNYQVGVGYLAAQAIFRGNDFRLTSLADDEEGLGRIEDNFRLTVLRVVNPKIISGLHIGSAQNQFDVESSHSGALHKPLNFRFIHTRLARSVTLMVRGNGNPLHYSQRKAA